MAIFRVTLKREVKNDEEAVIYVEAGSDGEAIAKSEDIGADHKAEWTIVDSDDGVSWAASTVACFAYEAGFQYGQGWGAQRYGNPEQWAVAKNACVRWVSGALNSRIPDGPEQAEQDWYAGFREGRNSVLFPYLRRLAEEARSRAATGNLPVQED